MRKLIFTTIFTALFSSLALAQETTVWLFGDKDDAKIIRQKAEIEAKRLKVVVNDESEQIKRLSQRETVSGDEKFDRIFREGRELMDKEEWAKAAAKFNEIVCDCPENKQVDAALYWLAYSYKKQKMFREANQTIARLLKSFSGSNWAADARVMQSEINRSSITTAAVSGQAITTVAPSFSGVEPFWATTTASQTPLEREDEIRLAAFQTLLAADTKRALELMGSEILRADSKASETLKREMIRSLRSSRYYTFGNLYNVTPGFSIAPLGQQNSSAATAEKQQNLNLMRETLMKGFQTEPSIKVRSEIIYSIAGINDETSVNYLAQLYPTESNKDLKKAIINSFISGTYTFVSGQAYAPFESLNGVTRVNGSAETERIATTTSTTSAQSATGSNQTPKTNPVRELRFNKLLEIFRSEKELELRRLALGNIQRFSGWSTRDGMIDSLAQLYDSETDEQFKVSIIYSFSNLSKNTQATNKLLNIAKNDKSDKMRLEAIRALRNNNSPEVIKFLEDLIQ